MNEPAPDDSADLVLVDFCEVFFEDRERGERKGLEHYLGLFPGHAAAVARKFFELTEHLDEISTEARTSSGGGERRARTIGSYRLVREIGRGGQAVVWLADDPRLGRRVAIKIFRGASFDSEGLERFRGEALRGASLVTRRTSSTSTAALPHATSTSTSTLPSCENSRTTGPHLGLLTTSRREAVEIVRHLCR